MSLTTSEMSPADISALTRKEGGLGENGAWWIIILFLFLFNGGFGGYGKSNAGAMDNYVLTSDFANIERKIDGVNNGLCSGFYQESQLVNGVNQNLATGFANAELSRANQQSALVQQMFGIQTAQQNCCCEQRQAIAGVNYNLSIQTRDILENQNTNTRAILDALNAQRIEAKDSKISELTQQNNALALAASQSAQNQYLIQQLRPAPVPAFSVATPYCYGTGTGCTG